MEHSSTICIFNFKFVFGKNSSEFLRLQNAQNNYFQIIAFAVAFWPVRLRWHQIAILRVFGKWVIIDPFFFISVI